MKFKLKIEAGSNW